MISENINEGVLFCDGFEEALIGIAEQYHSPAIAIYDRGKVIEILVQTKDMSYEDAEEYFNYNIFHAWVGEQTPMFLSYVDTQTLTRAIIRAQFARAARPKDNSPTDHKIIKKLAEYQQFFLQDGGYVDDYDARYHGKDTFPNLNDDKNIIDG